MALSVCTGTTCTVIGSLTTTIARCGTTRSVSRRGRNGFHSSSSSFLFRSSLGCGGQFRVDFSRIGWRDPTIIVVGLRQIVLAHQQCIETFATTKLEFFVHLNRLKRANFDANLATHADRDIDIEDLGVKLWFAHVIGLFVFALDDVNALRRAFLLTNLARDTTQACVRIAAVVNEKKENAIGFRQRIPLARILHGDQALLVEITSEKVPRRDRHSLQYACADHRSTSPITISMLPRITITSATVWPRHMSSKIVRLMKLGGRTR